MKTTKWNLGLLVLRIGYIIRKRQMEPEQFSLRWNIGVLILRLGYKLRGEIPQYTWRWNHI